MSVVVVSCSSHRESTMNPSLTYDEVLSRINLRNDGITTLQGEGSITIETPDGSQSGSFSVEIHKPDSLRLELRGPFGIRIGTLAISPGAFVYYDSRENVAITGIPDRRLVASTLNISMDVEEIIRALTGEFPIEAISDSIIRFYPKEDQFVLAYHDRDLLKEFRIDGESYCVASYREVNREGEVPVTAFASRIVERGNIQVPTLLRIVFPVERRSISIAYDDVTLNGETSCRFHIPEGSRIIRK
jgi:hypothetical protein